MKSDEEMAKDNAALLAGEEPSEGSVNTVKNVPAGFSEWVRANGARIDAAKSLPYFIRDNKAVVDNILSPQPVRSAADVAKERHAARTAEQTQSIRRAWTLRSAEVRHNARTKEQEQGIKKAWYDRKATLQYGNSMLRIMGGVSDETKALAEALKSGNLDEVMTEAKKLKEIGKQIMSVGYFNNPLALVREYSLKEIIPAARYLRAWSTREKWRKLTFSEKKKKLADDYKMLSRDPNLQSGFAADLLWHELNRLPPKVKLSSAAATTLSSETGKNAVLRHSHRTQGYYEDIHHRWALREMRVKNWSDFKASTETLTEELERYKGTAEEFKAMLRDVLRAYNSELPKKQQLSSEFIEEVIATQAKRLRDDNIIRRPGAKTHIQDFIARNAPKYDLRTLVLSYDTGFNQIAKQRASLVRSDINRLAKAETELESICKLAGGDRTKGSCFSLAQAFAARRLGYDVLDYRGGISCDVHGFDDRAGYLADFGRFRKKSSEEVFNYVTSNTSIGECYLLATNLHAAIVKKMQGDKLFYLELQSSNESWYKNGWHRLTGPGMLKARFRSFQKGISGQLISFTDLAKHFDLLAHNLETIHNTGVQAKGPKGGYK